MELQKAISAILFYYAEPMTLKRLSVLLKHPENDIREALVVLEKSLEETGLRLLQNGDEVTLGTAVESSALIESITKEELSKELSKAALETLAIVLYKGPLTRSEIDYIRGVNSTFILRNLLVRGLVEKVENPSDQRSYRYKATFQLLEYMGVGKIEELPNFHDVLVQLNSFEQTKSEEKKDFNLEKNEMIAETDTMDISDAELIADAMDNEENELNVSADIIEEDEAIGGYADQELREHTDLDRKD